MRRLRILIAVLALCGCGRASDDTPASDGATTGETTDGGETTGGDTTGGDTADGDATGGDTADADGTAGSNTELDLDVTNPNSGVTWWCKAFFPADAGPDNRYPAVVIVPGGSNAGSEEQEKRALMAEAGYVVVVFDADGRGNTEGVEDFNGHVHQDGLKAVIEATAAMDQVDPERIGLFTGSFGITMGSGTLARYPDLPVRWLLDFEGPANRDDTGGCGAIDIGHIDHDCDDEAFWSQREAAAHIKSVALPYLRIQKDKDHAQPDNDHAVLMIDNATHTDHGGGGVSPWTRVNDADMNAANAVYGDGPPPKWYAGMEYKSGVTDLALIAELFAMGGGGQAAITTVVYNDAGLEAHLCVPEGQGPFPVAVYNHGGVGTVVGGDLEGTCLALRALGYLALSPRRRAEVPIDGHIDDVLAGLDYALAHEKADPDEVALLGYSRGGYLTTLALTLRDDIDRAVIMAPAPVKGKLDVALEDVSAVTASSLLLVASNDLPEFNVENEDHVATTQAVHDALTAAGKDSEMKVLPPFEDNGHDLFKQVLPGYWKDIEAFLAP